MTQMFADEIPNDKYLCSSVKSVEGSSVSIRG